jgi:hypothetical protein
VTDGHHRAGALALPNEQGKNGADRGGRRGDKQLTTGR